MTFTGMSATDQYPICPLLKSLEDKCGFDPAAAHHSNYAYIRGVLLAGGTCQVSTGIGTPVT
jgi:hypothetical protein